MIELKQLKAGYPEKMVLENVNCTIPSGKITVILGPNGCGKSTLLKLLCGILLPKSGEILLDGQEIRSFTQRQLAQKVAFLSQTRQIPDITVRRMVLHGRFPYLSYPRRYRKEDYTAAEASMRRLGILDLAEQPLTKLSGGQRQKVYIAMALAQDTPWVLLDEPTTYLDVAYQMQMMDHARFLREQGKTVVMVLHDLSLALQVADHVVLMENGQVACTGNPEEVYSTGQLNRIFGVRVCRIQTENRWHYYCVAAGGDV